MAFLLNEIVPWGRNLGEYRRMFALTDVDMKLKIFSICDLDGNSTEFTKRIIDYFDKLNKIIITKSEYQFQKGENEMLIIK